MSSAGNAPLYSPQLLALAVELADYPFDPAAPFTGEARSRSCGSTVLLSSGDEMRSLGLRVTACAVGQASAAIFARHCEGADAGTLADTLDALEGWLASKAPMPDWPDMHLIAPARDYPGRHGAILLPWKAALDALSKGGEAR